jgi:oxaloacetate decarboxylase alpha subunit
MSDKKPLGITELVLRDAHQSLLATRMRIEDMLPIADKLDQVGFWSIESWGGATFDACIRYLGVSTLCGRYCAQVRRALRCKRC